MGLLLQKIKNLFRPGHCPDCGWWIACDHCSEVFDDFDSQLKLSQAARVRRGEISPCRNSLSSEGEREGIVRSS